MNLKFKAIFPALAMVVLLCGAAYAGMYFDSAHGNADYGVLWTTFDTEYTQGHCGHCHVQHYSIDDEEPVPGGGPYHYALIYDDVIGLADMFCFVCHREADLGYGQVTNYPYSINFGGFTTLHYSSIFTQFTSANSMPGVCGSRHHLGQIYNGLKGSVGQAWGFSTDPDPCVGCHPPHAAQRNNPPTTSGDLNTCIRLPSKYASTAPADFLWGDDEGERMDDYAAAHGGVYQPPYYGDTTNGKFEPTGTAVDYAGDRTPDYVTFCLECHQYQLNDPDRSNAVVDAINWDKDSNADLHGTGHAECNSGGFEGTLRPPYSEAPGRNYILSCLDCHEPHGTYRRLHLIRRMINGELVAEDAGSCDQNTDMSAICLRCHDFPHSSWGGCEVCHENYTGNSFHGGGTFPTSSCIGQRGF